MNNPLESLPPIILVDGSSYLYRAFYASHQAGMTTKAGQPTGAIKVITSMLRKLIKEYPASHIIVVFDAPGKTFRSDLYPEYKANRKSMPDELRSQVQPIQQIVSALGMPLIIEQGVEADDVIGTLAVKIAAKGHSVLIASGDKDLAQLVNKQINLIDSMKERYLDPEGVKEQYGIPPSLIIDYLALRGDASDNIPGMAGVGEKTALALLQGIGNIKTIYNQLDKIESLGFRGSKTLAEKMQSQQEIVELSYKLAQIKTDLSLDIDLENATPPVVNINELNKLLSQFELKSWIDEVEEPDQTSAVTTRDYQLILNETELDSWLEQLKQVDSFAIDTETTSLDYMQAELVGLSFSLEAGKAAYVPVGHDYLGAPEQISRQRLLEKIKPLLESERPQKIGQNLKYDLNILASYGIKLNAIAFDTMLESYVLNSTATSHGMDSLADYYLGIKSIKFEDIAGKGKNQLTFNQIELEQAVPYAAEDADITLQLHQALYPCLKQQPQLQCIYEEIEKPLIPVIAAMERNGAKIDSQLLNNQTEELAQRLQVLENQIHELAGEVFNPASPKQLKQILFEKLKLPVLKKTPKGIPSTAEDVLQELALDYPLPQRILEYRSLTKLKSTYTDKLPQMVNKTTGRIHTSYHQAVTATGRLSSSNPNLQNIPIRTAEGRRIRQAFIAPEGYCILAADYSQIELRIMAHLSKDERLLKAFNQDEDIHRITAAEVFGTQVDQVNNEQRRRAKAINFGLMYGMSAFGLAKQLGISNGDARQYIEHYFKTYPKVQEYMESVKQQAKEQGYVETIYGRRLYLPDINASNGIRRQAAERTAINAPMQGSAADIIKKAMISVNHCLQQNKSEARMIIQVHDELVFEVPENQKNILKQQVIDCMSRAAQLDVALKVDVGTGSNWEQAH